jgi:hypothetical protein
MIKILVNKKQFDKTAVGQSMTAEELVALREEFPWMK